MEKIGSEGLRKYRMFVIPEVQNQLHIALLMDLLYVSLIEASFSKLSFLLSIFPLSTPAH